MFAKKNLQSKAQQETVEGCKEEKGVTNQAPWERGSSQLSAANPLAEQNCRDA